MKRCGCCELEKEEINFGKRKASKDGLAHKCKLCQRVYDKARAGDKHRAEQRSIYAQTEEGRISGSKAKSDYRKRNPNKSKAHALVSRKVRSGSLFRENCEVCGESKTHAHHDDYAKPLNVRWLCPIHHKAWHTKNGEALNP